MKVLDWQNRVAECVVQSEQVEAEVFSDVRGGEAARSRKAPT